MRTPKHKFKAGQVVWWDRNRGEHCPRGSRVCAVVESIEFPRFRGAEPIYRIGGGWLSGFKESELREKP